MDERTFRVLEFDKIKELLAERAASSLGKRRCRAISPATDLHRIRGWQSETTEGVLLTSDRGRFPLGGLSDIEEPLKKARVASLLDGAALLRVSGCLRAASAVRKYLEPSAGDAPRLWALGEQLTVDDALVFDIETSLDDDGAVRPDASPELVRLHRQAASIEEEMRTRMMSILGRAAERDLVQDAMIVSREGRMCIPIKASLQSRFQGVIHDRSSTGVTVFMEPLEIVQLGNKLKETLLEIRDAEEAVLRELTGRVATIAEGILADQTSLGILDFISAKARLAVSLQATEPAMTGDGVTSLRSARHPLIPDEHVVPTSIWIGDEFSTLVITGPNTGGKTVSLKTLGLLTLMAMCGLHIPAESGSQVSVFENVWADIGDEQSIEQSLSTFSSHMTQIVKIINRIYAFQNRNVDADGDEASGAPQISALVLLDEVGAGTDPTEGAALAKTILSFLHQAGCRTVATTHYNSLKLFAYAQDGMQNAAVQFDHKTLKPTYRLLIGHPGSSNAFEIARRLGLPKRLVAEARETLDEEQINLERAIAEMRDSRERYDRQRREIDEESDELASLQAEYERKLQRLGEREAQALGEGFESALRIVREAEEQARAIIAQLQAQPKQSRVTQQLRDEVAALKQDLTRAAREHAREVAGACEGAAASEDAGPGFDVADGAWVHVKLLGKDGVIARRTGPESFEVSVGKMRIETTVDELGPAKNPPSTEARALAHKMQVRKAASVKDEIDMRGERVEEALPRLEKYLDDAALAGLLSVRIIHGKGTGALREAVHELLRKNPHVRGYEACPPDEGGEGATAVSLS